jgi:thiol-disulfide isomerase/thioredoxin
MRFARTSCVLVASLVLAGCGDITLDLADSQREVQPEPAKVQVLAFTAGWCEPCQRDNRQLQGLRRRGVNVIEIDIDENPALASRYGVRSVPTYVVLEDGIETHRTGNILILLKIIATLLSLVIPLI